jgi:propionyl-CoA carboxylase alpha chain
MKKILVANRGEIALRVMRTIKDLGMATVAVYSDADRAAPHVLFADEAIHLGASPSAQSYLQMDKIIEEALKLGVDGIHPGYGFLSENAIFSEKTAAAGMIFIGPSPQAIRTMGSKLAAKEAVKQFGVPMVPGIERAIESVAEAKEIAAKVGFPVLIKASAGGGGKGMRVVENLEELQQQMERAISEAEAAFGDGAVFIEKYVASPKHIEIQIIADKHGNICYLFERECSIQRRHQKLVEEAPCAVLTPEIRQKMGEAAVNVARACNYYGAGTVEFLADQDLNFYFLEMNTRLQVEHPVTELITGLDLVKLQIDIANGMPLPFRQEDLKINGHAIELRICAEDPANNFLPSIGTLTTYQTPKGYGVRVDDGYQEGMEIPIFYDPMIAKLIVHAPTRDLAISRMLRAISEYQIQGIATTLPFGTFVMNHPVFKKGVLDTNFITNYFKPEMLETPNEADALLAAQIASLLVQKNQTATTSNDNPNNTVITTSNWRKRSQKRG